VSELIVKRQLSPCESGAMKSEKVVGAEGVSSNPELVIRLALSSAIKP
jgi:hypothetical protein